jgi:hypothetical protein
VESPLRPRGSGSGAGQPRTTAGVAEIVGGWIVEVACKTVAALNGRLKMLYRKRMLIGELLLNCQQVSFVVNTCFVEMNCWKMLSSAKRFDCWMKCHWLIDELKPFLGQPLFFLPGSL